MGAKKKQHSILIEIQQQNKWIVLTTQVSGYIRDAAQIKKPKSQFSKQTCHEKQVSREKKYRKVEVFKKVVTSVISYANQSWAITDKHKSRIQRIEMRCVRKIKAKRRTAHLKGQKDKGLNKRKKSQTFEAEAGLRQGNPLSATLFNYGSNNKK